MIRTLLSVLLLAAVTLATPVDWILSAGTVVTMDGSGRVIPDGAVAISADRIVAVGPRADIGRRFQPKQRIDAPDAILTPGLVNTHTHAPMALFRGIADDLNLQDWLQKYIFPAEARNVNPQFVRDGTRLACLEMLLGGTTTYTDMYYFEEEIARATKECGMRGVLGQTIIRFPVADAKTPAEGLERAERFLRQFANDPLIVPAVAPHALYTNTRETLEACRALANKYRAPLLIHLSETKAENDGSSKEFQSSPVRILEKWQILGGRTLGAHGVWISSADIQILKQREVGIAHCPSSNMMLASGVAPIMEYLKAGVNVGLGPDGPAGSNNDFSMFEEMDLAAKLQKVHTGDPTALTARQAFAMATIGGARALGMETEIGSVEPGKKADLILIRTTAPHAVPLYDVYSALVYNLKSSDVRHVMVNGRLVVRDRRVLTLNQAEVLKASEAWKKKISDSVATPQPGK